MTCSRPREQNRSHWIRSASDLRCWAPIPIRMVVAYGFMAHGYSELAQGPEHLAVILHVLGVPMPGLNGLGDYCH